MKQVKLYDSDGRGADCPFGGSVSYPMGTLKKIKVCDILCTMCPCYFGVEYDSKAPLRSYIMCSFGETSTDKKGCNGNK